MSTSQRALRKRSGETDRDAEEYDSGASASSDHHDTVENVTDGATTQDSAESGVQESSCADLGDTAREASPAHTERSNTFTAGPLHPPESAMARLCNDMGINYDAATPHEQQILRQKMGAYVDAIAARDKAANEAQTKIAGLMSEIKAVGQVVADRKDAEAEAEARAVEVEDDEL